MSAPTPGGWPSPPPGWQQGWPQQQRPPQQGNGLKWLLIAVAVLLVIGISVGATLLFTRGSGSGGTTTATSAALGDIASANDTGPVSIITDEPTCAAYIQINNTMAEVEAGGWAAQRASLGPVAEWTNDQRAQVLAVAAAMRDAADQVVPLARQTPHRVVRELYEQFAAYGRAYAESAAAYKPSDNGLATANVNFGSALASMCNAITYGSASRPFAAQAGPTPSQTEHPGNVSDSKTLMSTPDAVCSQWIARSDQFTVDTSEWEKLDSSIPASQWTPDRRALEQSVQPLISAYANAIQSAGQQSGKAILEDFASVASLYLQAYVTVSDRYTSADGWLSAAGFRITNAVSGACRAAAGNG